MQHSRGRRGGRQHLCGKTGRRLVGGRVADGGRRNSSTTRGWCRRDGWVAMSSSSIRRRSRGAGSCCSGCGLVGLEFRLEVGLVGVVRAVGFGGWVRVGVGAGWSGWGRVRRVKGFARKKADVEEERNGERGYRRKREMESAGEARHSGCGGGRVWNGR